VVCPDRRLPVRVFFDMCGCPIGNLTYINGTVWSQSCRIQPDFVVRIFVENSLPKICPFWTVFVSLSRENLRESYQLPTSIRVHMPMFLLYVTRWIQGVDGEAGRSLGNVCAQTSKEKNNNSSNSRLALATT